jgi:hypothetical protein
MCDIQTLFQFHVRDHLFFAASLICTKFRFGREGVMLQADEWGGRAVGERW